MRIQEYRTRYETLLKMEWTSVERSKMLLGLLGDIERSANLLTSTSETQESEREELRALYREVLMSFDSNDSKQIESELRKMSAESEKNNTLVGFHLKSKKDEPRVLSLKEYTWHIPKTMRNLNIQQGDIVGVGKHKKPFLVSNVFREEFEETGERYKRVTAFYERFSEKE
ncbi:DUF5839 family protein [Planococcus kocurii]|uniref:DUF5839 family protein n=1 Tax=Bacillati TaxID=1783272 RepID=UPI0033CA18E8